MTKGGYVPPSHGGGDSSHESEGESIRIGICCVLSEKCYLPEIGIPMEEEGSGKVKEFVASKGLTSFEAQQLLQKWGRNELEDKKKSKVGRGRWKVILLL